MNRNIRSVLSLVLCLTFMLSFSVLSQADNNFNATGKALQDQGFVRPDTGGPVGNDEMALNRTPNSSPNTSANPFQEGDALKYGGLFGPLYEDADIEEFFEGGTLDFLKDATLDLFKAPPPDTRSMGFEKDPDHYIPITRLPRD